MLCGGDGGYGRLVAGAGFYLLKPYWESNPAFTTRTQLNQPNNSTTTTNDTRDFDYDVGFAPRAWLACLTSQGLGGRVAYWHFQGSATEAAGNFNTSFNPTIAMVTPGELPLVADSFGDILLLDNELRFDVWDWEVLRELGLDDSLDFPHFRRPAVCPPRPILQWRAGL
jgi:hypothetical protein